MYPVLCFADSLPITRYVATLDQTTNEDQESTWKSRHAVCVCLPDYDRRVGWARQGQVGSHTGNLRQSFRNAGRRSLGRFSARRREPAKKPSSSTRLYDAIFSALLAWIADSPLFSSRVWVSRDRDRQYPGAGGRRSEFGECMITQLFCWRLSISCGILRSSLAKAAGLDRATG